MTDIHEHPYVKEMGRQIDELEKENEYLTKHNRLLNDALARALDERDAALTRDT